MDQKKFLRLLDNPRSAGPDDLAGISDMLKEFPYFQSAHLLLAGVMHNSGHIRSDRQLKIASAYAADRRLLYQIIHSKPEENPDVSDAASKESEPIFALDAAEEKNEDTDSLNVMNPFAEVIEEKMPEPDTIPKSVSSEEDLIPQYSYDPALSSDLKHESEIPEKNTDPREVLKKRLEEILGKSETEKDEPDSTIATPVSAVDHVPSELLSTLAEKNSVSETETETQKEIPYIPINDIAGDDTGPVIFASPEEKSIPAPEEILAEEASKPEFLINKIELEYALEESILSSIEKLPEIDAASETKEFIPVSLESREGSVINESSKSLHSFSEWLEMKSASGFGFVEEVHAGDPLAAGPASGISQTHQKVIEDPSVRAQEKDNVRDEKSKLIDKFIATEPKIIPSKAEFYSPITQAKRSVEEAYMPVSETLAKIYTQQGHHEKARYCYEKLSLLYPEKKRYFAALIREIDEDLNNPNNEDL
ncbi:MAG: hypothetical protein DWQ44_05635 [Bacteroidetes bacterium]|nr:MAG: hypothetical protein DWQ33_01220 [Bacteroidota bacterium]REK03504.1 MAG: hypothetical protein DWQ39_09910 [Bacteroidota bacterium]REK34809.1 MAG: hypothetical protein DWQ44_05635 [Bacteroidota bacterium]REK51311.1 MAG: hypothetical protein DWQ48_01515 [Bacteroidota bacterium]